MNASRTARDRARAELTREIKDAARRQVAAEGAQRLSLRAVARELGLASSALYRYFPSRDDLLTALIVDAYNALGAAVETAAASATTPRDGWRAFCTAARTWARTHPHEYALVYGTPIPGYAAPQETVSAAARVPLAMVSLLKNAPEGSVPAALKEQLSTVEVDIPPAVLARALLAWTQVFGVLSFELFGHLVGSADPADEFFAYTVEQTADLLGLA